MPVASEAVRHEMAKHAPYSPATLVAHGQGMAVRRPGQRRDATRVMRREGERVRLFRTLGRCVEFEHDDIALFQTDGQQTKTCIDGRRDGHRVLFRG